MTDDAWKILLIDDDEDDYLLTRTMLSEARGRKFHLEWANTFEAGKKALALSQNGAAPAPCGGGYRAVLVDYDLGVHSGIELIRAAARAGCAAPLILFTGRGSYDVDLEAMQAGATMYLTKDEVNPLLLERAIRYAVQMKQQTAQIREREVDLLKTNAALQAQEEALIAREAILESVVESAQGPVWSVDRDYRLTLANADFQRASVDSTGRQVPMGQSMIEDWVSPKTGSAFWKSLYDRALAGEQAREERAFISASGAPIYHEYICSPITAADGSVVGAACFSRDITSIRAAQVDLADFLENTHDSFFALDRDWRIIYANRRFGQIAGRDPASLVGQNFWKAFPKYRGTEVERRYREAMQTQQPVHFQAGGYYSSQWYDISLYPTRNGLSVFGSDRSQEHQAMNALRSSENRYRAFFENLRDLVQVMELVWNPEDEVPDRLGAPDTLGVPGKRGAEPPVAVDWIWRDANPPALAVLGATRDAVIGSRATERLDADFVRRLLPGYSRVAQTGEPLEYEISFGGRDYVVTVFRMEDNLLGSSASDITDRKRVERDLITNEALLRDTNEALRERNGALRASEDRLRRIFDTSIIGIVTRDAAGNIHDANQAFLNLLGYSREVFFAEPRTINRLIPEEYHPVEEQIVQEVLATGASKPHEKEFICADGGRVPVLVGHTLLERTDGGEIIGFVVDMTELQAARQSLEEYAEKLKRSNQELEQFAFIASHDLQEPLRKIQSFAEIIDRDLRGKVDARTADHLDRMHSAAKRMQDMIRDLLELSRVNTRGQPFTQVDLNVTAEEVTSMLEGLIERTHGEVKVEPLPTIEADPIQMRQLLQNLIGNALKFHKPDVTPRVVVAALPAENPGGRPRKREAGQPERVTITVQDNGIGFEQEYFERILEPFQRLHGRSEYEGTGIGLAICKQIVTRHHGQIAAESVPGEGSKFIITLPVRQEG